MGSRQALVALAIIALAGCGGKTALKPSGCVQVFFYARNQGTTTPAQVRTVRQKLATFRDKLVSYRFVSKWHALAEMRRRYPHLVQRMPYNPFPDAFEATPGSVDYGHQLVDALTPRPPGVRVVRYSRKRRHC